MKQRPDLNKLSKEVYEANKAKGFHDTYISNETLLMLVITELSEAVEADRSTRRNSRADMEWFNNRISTSRYYKGLDPKISKERAYEVIYNETVKGSIEEELADAVIRLLDLAGARGYELNRFLLKIPNMNKTFPENIFRIVNEIAYYKWSMEERINFALLNIQELCKEMKIDLWLHVELKLLYNQSRPHKHNKLY